MSASRRHRKRLPAKALSRRNINIDLLSGKLCGEAEETTDHLFAAYQLAIYIWSHIEIWCKLPQIFAFSFRHLDIPNSLATTKQKELILLVIQTTFGAFGKAIIGVPGSGSDIMFWIDSWLGAEPFYVRFPALFAIERSKSCTAADRVKIVRESMVLEFQWSSYGLSFEEESELIVLSNLIGSIKLDQGIDSWRWNIGNEGGFSVQTIKRALLKVNDQVSINSFFWNNWLPKKLNFMALSAHLDWLPTMVALTSRRMVVNSCWCVICNEQLETAEHLFVTYRMAQYIWEKISEWCRLKHLIIFSLNGMLANWEVVPRSGRRWFTRCL
ncbi:hypothetical protein E3N88_33568 [Mikania micrantha]|uniref:Reverse transcriptase zinc-binding domain-containing protein n=1 Tax=Mikania micrantha TaxID=192012 RepID=A0A5N6MC32_9ASTR|nr:hypothetical protein E3N88_33568 [Mikania micrantha]